MMKKSQMNDSRWEGGNISQTFCTKKSLQHTLIYQRKNVWDVEISQQGKLSEINRQSKEAYSGSKAGVTHSPYANYANAVCKLWGYTPGESGGYSRFYSFRISSHSRRNDKQRNKTKVGRPVG